MAIRAELVDAVLPLVLRAITEDSAELLDLGCGTGWWLQTLSREREFTAALHGIDVLPERIESARGRLQSASLLVGDVRDLPYPKERFSAVTAFTVLSSLAGNDDVEKALSEAWRVLTPGGVLVIWEPRIENPMNRFTLLVTPRLVRRALPLDEARVALEARRMTLFPPLARRLGRRTRVLYPRLAAVPLLCSHRLMWIRKPDNRSLGLPTLGRGSQ